MNFNSILIGSEDPPVSPTTTRSSSASPPASDGGYTVWHVGQRRGHGWTPQRGVAVANPQPGRLIWNIESDDVQGDFERFKAAGAIVIREPYGFEGEPDSLIATFADPDDNYFQLTTPMGPPEG